MAVGESRVLTCPEASREVERAMGIEPMRAALQSLLNAAFRDAPTAACDWRANFRVMRGNVGLRETTPAFAFRLMCVSS